MDDFVFEDQGSGDNIDGIDNEFGFAPPIEYNNNSNTKSKHISFNINQTSVNSIDSQLLSNDSGKYDNRNSLSMDDQSLESSGVLWLIDTFNLENRVLNDSNYVDYTIPPTKLSLPPNTKNISKFASQEASENDIDFNDQFDPKSFILLDDNVTTIVNKSPPKFDRNGSKGLMLDPESNKSIPLEILKKNTPYLNNKYINKTTAQIREGIKKQEKLDRIKSINNKRTDSNPKFKAKLNPLATTFPKTKTDWSKDNPPTSGLFEDVNRLTILNNQRKRFVKTIEKSLSQKKLNTNSFPTVSTAVMDPFSGEFVPASNISHHDNGLGETSSADEFRGLGDILVLDHGKVGSNSKEAASQLMSFGIAKNSNSHSPTFEDQSDLLGNNRGFDPLYRIMREESERIDEENRLKNTLLNTKGPKCANDGARKLEIDLMAISSSVMRASEIITLNKFESLPPKLWVTARIIYILLVFYHDLILTGEAFEGPDVPKVATSSIASKPKSPQPPQSINKTLKKETKLNIIKPIPLQMMGSLNDMINSSFAETHPGDDEYLTNLENKVGMKLFWSKFNITRNQNHISCETAYSYFNWNYLKELMSMPNEFAYALYMIESGGVQNIILDQTIEDIPENLDDYYSKFPGELLPVLREAARASSFHPSVVVSLSPQAGRLTSWTRRVIAGIYSIKQSCMRLPVLSSPSKNEERGDEYGNKSLFSTLNLTTNTSQSLANFKHHSLESAPSMPSLNIHVAIDGSALTHICSLVALSLSRPLDRVSIIAVQNPTDVKNTPTIMNELVKNYENLINSISNSPTQRVILSETFINEVNSSPSPRTKRSVSFKDIQSINFIKDVPIVSNFDIDTLGVEKLVTLSLQSHVDMLVVGYGWGRNFEFDQKLYKKLFNFRTSSFGLVLVSQFTKDSIFQDYIHSTPNRIVKLSKPIVTTNQLAFTPSRFVIFIDNNKHSRAVFNVRTIY
jgi:hypothetical protein